MAAGSARTEPIFYLPIDIAKILRCSEWWVKEQARKGRIPFCWIGGGYRFTPDHLDEIARVFERKAAQADVITADRVGVRRRQIQPNYSVEPSPLTARIPRRSRLARAAEQGAT
jgi:hypothetical protein